MYTNTFSTQHILHGACVTYTPECMHHTISRAHDDTLNILHNIYSTYTSWRVCHVRVTHTQHILHSAYIYIWHIPTDVYTTHKSPFMWIHYIYSMMYTQHMHHGPWGTCHAYMEQHMQRNNTILAVYVQR